MSNKCTVGMCTTYVYSFTPRPEEILILHLQTYILRTSENIMRISAYKIAKVIASQHN